MIAEVIVPSMLAAAMGLDDNFTATGYREYLNQIKKSARDPTDSVEAMLLEQLALAHLSAVRLQASAGIAVGLESVKVMNAAAARILAEFRRTALRGPTGVGSGIGRQPTTFR